MEDWVRRCLGEHPIKRKQSSFHKLNRKEILLMVLLRISRRSQLERKESDRWLQKYMSKWFVDSIKPAVSFTFQMHTAVEPLMNYKSEVQRKNLSDHLVQILIQTR